MADIWYSNAEAPLDWQAVPVPDDSRYVQVDLLRNSSEPRLRSRRRLRATRREATDCKPSASGKPFRFLLVRTGSGRIERWFVVLGPDMPLLVNGRPVMTGLVALSDRDLLGFAGDARELAFTTQRAARVERFDGSVGTFCPRCKLSLEPGQHVVVCPGCGTTHHQDEQAELPCWKYGETCVHCDCSTTLHGPAFLWTPDEL